MYPEFTRMVEIVASQNPFQKKRVRKFVSQQDPAFWTYAESLCTALGSSFLKTSEGRTSSAQAYNRMCMDFLREQIRFKKMGVYLLDDARVARKNVYDRAEVMQYYMVGLFLSYLFWPNHYKMLHFFKEHIPTMPPVGRYLDIAPGHGLFAVETLQQFPGLKANLLDISPTSIEVTRTILASFQVPESRFEFINGDFLTVPIPGGDFDFISMGEVLEHVTDGLGFLVRARDLITDNGQIYMTTCANAPAIDHIYHFHNVQEIRDLIHEAGLRIVKEGAWAAEDIPEIDWEAELVVVNYCAILAKDV